MADPITDPRLLRALAEAQRLADLERTRQEAAAEIPGTLPGLGASTLYAAPLSAAERATNAQVAREREAARRSPTTVHTPTMLRELGDIASMYGVPGAEAAADFAASATPDNEYDPLAMGSAFNPLSDEAIAAAESLATGRGYRARQAELEQRFEQAQERSPGSAALGSTAGLIASAPVTAGVTGARGAAIGAGLGGAGGFLGSEGESGTDRALSALSGGLLGAAIGGTAGRLARSGAAMRDAAQAGTLGGGARYALGSVMEGAGQGAGYGALSSGGTVDEGLFDASLPGLADRPLSSLAGLAASDFLPTVRVGELGRDVATGGALGALTSVPFGVAGGIGRSMRPRGARLPGIADDLPTTDLDETALIGDETLQPSDDTFRSAMGGSTPLKADEQRLRASGVMERPIMRRVARAFGGGAAGVRRAAAVARRLGLSGPGISTLEQAGTAAEVRRDIARNRLSALHNDVAEGGGVFRGEAMARPLEEDAARLRRLAVEDPNVEQRIGIAQDLADDLRFGRRGSPLRNEYESLRAAEYTPESEIGLRELPEDIAELPGLEREVTALPLREAVPAQRLPYREGRALIDEWGNQINLWDRAADPAYASRAAVLQRAHRSLTNERNAAARSVLGERFGSEMMPENEAYRLTSLIAPEGQIPVWLQRNEGILRGELGAVGSDNAAQNFIRRKFAQGYAQVEPSINAMIAERLAAPGAMRLEAPAILRNAGAELSRLGITPPAAGVSGRALSAAAIGSMQPASADVAPPAVVQTENGEDPDYNPYSYEDSLGQDGESESTDPDYNPYAHEDEEERRRSTERTTP